MNQSILDRTRFERIETYLLDRMGLEERAHFQQELREDPSLRAELDLQRENTLAIELGGMERQLKQLRAAHTERPSTGIGKWSRPLRYAAAVAVLLGAALWYVARPSENEKIYAEFHVADPGLPVPMSATSKPIFHDAMVDYKMGIYDKAIAKWRTQLADAPDNDTLRYYIATAHLEAGDLNAAIALYKGLLDDGDTNFRSKAEWYLFLAQLRVGNEAAVRATEVAPDSPYASRIATIKERLGPP